MEAQPVGVIGLGSMGNGIAAALLRRRFPVYAYDPRPEALTAFAAAGGKACRSPAEVAAQAGVIVSSVLNSAQTQEVLFAHDGCLAAMRPGSVFVMCSTVDPEWSLEAETRLAAREVLYLDAPMSGGPVRAAQGELSLMTSGVPAAYQACESVLDAIASNVFRLGDRAGAGSKAKLINQLLAGVNVAVAAEAMALGIREGIDPSALYEVITHSAGNSWMFENRMKHVLSGDYDALSALDIFVKDLSLALDLARRSRFPLPLASTAHQMFMHASSSGLGLQDAAALVKLFPGIRVPERGSDA